MSSQEDARRFGALFPRVFRRFRRRSPLGAYRPSPESLSVLQHLARTGPMTVREASAHFQRSQAATSEILARLERRGLLERMADERDRRRTLVYLTPKGEDVLEAESRVLSPRELGRAFGKLPGAVREGLIRGMEELVLAGEGQRRRRRG